MAGVSVRLVGVFGSVGSDESVIVTYGEVVGYYSLGIVSVSIAGGASLSGSVVVITGSTDYGKGGSLFLSTGSGGAMILRVCSSMINEGGSVRILACFALGYDMAGGLSIV